MSRPITACLLVLCLAMFLVETPAPDVHDGDATAAVSTSAPDGTDEEPGSDDSEPVHSFHMCHCVHAHSLVALGNGASIVAHLPRLSLAVAYVTRVPQSREREPQLRPPIAA